MADNDGLAPEVINFVTLDTSRVISGILIHDVMLVQVSWN